MMENLKLTRIDFRLIHGQVMTRWVAKYEIESIVVIDDRCCPKRCKSSGMECRRGCRKMEGARISKKQSADSV